MSTPSNGRAAAAAGASIEQELRAVRELLGMEVAWIAEFADGQQVFRSLDGDPGSFGFSDGGEMPLDGTYCQRLVAGRIPSLVPDTRAESDLAVLEITREARIGSYIGVPIELVDGTTYGTLCCASHRPNGSLTERDVKFMQGVSRRIAAQLEEARLTQRSNGRP